MEIVLVGDTYDDAYAEAIRACEEHGMTFVHPFDDPKIIAGNGTIAMEIMQEMEGTVDYLVTAVGGGGLAAGISRLCQSRQSSDESDRRRTERRGFDEACFRRRAM